MKWYLLGGLVTCTLLTVHAQNGGGRSINEGFVSRIVRASPLRRANEGCNRNFDVYVPKAFDEDPNRTFPIVYHLTGLGGNDNTYRNLDRRVLDELIETGQVVPMIIVAPDPQVLNYRASYYINSLVVGDPTLSFNNKFEDYFINELIPYIDRTYRQKNDAQGKAAPFRAIMGQSMGGYGSLYLGIKYPELFGSFAGDSATPFWTFTTDIASPPELPDFPNGNPVFSFTKILRNDLIRSNGYVSPTNDKVGYYSWFGALSPNSEGIGPQGENCNDDQPACKMTQPFCIDYPFQTTATPNGLLVNYDNGDVATGNMIPNAPILDVWQQFDPFFLLDSANLDVLKQQTLYLDAGADLDLEPANNVGARKICDKLTQLDVNHEYLLFDGGHVTCTGGANLSCYRFTTNMKLFSGKFAEADQAPLVRMAGQIDMTFSGTSSFVVQQDQRIGIEVDHDAAQQTTTNATFTFNDASLFDIKGGFQVGNRYGKANLLNTPARANDMINLTLNVDGAQARVRIDQQGYLGFGAGLSGSNAPVANFWGVTSLTNVTSVTLNFMRGRFEHNQIASSLEQRASLLALGASDAYTVNLSKDNFVIAGGGNLASMTQANRIHPTVQDIAGPVDPGGIRNSIVQQPATEFDKFYGPPKGVYGSETFSENLMDVGILSSSVMLFDTNKQPLPQPANQMQLFNYLKVDNYYVQGRKRAPINLQDGELIVGYVSPRTITTNGQQQEVLGINRVPIDTSNACTVGQSFDVDRALEQGAVGITLGTVNGQEELIRVYELDPVV